MAMFDSVQLALYVAFRVEVEPASTKGATQLAVEALKRRNWCLDEAPSGRIDASGLTQLEFRGECSRMRGQVASRLTEPERDAIFARYGQQATKSVGVAGLTEYLRPLCNLNHDGARKAVMWSIYAPSTTVKDRRTGRKDDWTLRKLSDEYGIPRSTLADARRVLAHHAQRLERLAEDRIGEFWTMNGTVGDLIGEAVSA